ncbi:hypothetical protein GQ53DRAFT_818678 [Thozetella sp. PMI_491]|nr:hypothetical protein GQ53DRAFT_818678 [Thozetella sp. PMI_491]
MHRNTRDWMVHSQAMASAIEQRGADLFERCPYLMSSARFVVLREKLFSAGSRSAKDMQNLENESELSNILWPGCRLQPGITFIPRTPADSIFDDLASAIAIRRRHSRLFFVGDDQPEKFPLDQENARSSPASLYKEAEVLLRRRQIFLDCAQESISEVPAQRFSRKDQDMASYVTLAQTLSTKWNSTHPSPATALSFDALEDFQCAFFNWIVIITVHLIQSDIVTSSHGVGDGILGDYLLPGCDGIGRTFRQHREILVEYASLILRSIPYATQYYFDLSPFFHGELFSLAQLILTKECEHLRRESGRDGDLEICTAARDALRKYLEWVSARKTYFEWYWDE